SSPAAVRGLYAGTAAAPTDAGGHSINSLYDFAPAHFDSETFSKGSARLRTTWGLIFQHLWKGERENTLLLMGSALHSIQDFFAHSNFIELKGEGGAIGLTSGYWPDNAKVAGKCHHVDLNKDDPSRAGHSKAIGRAVRESKAFIGRVEAEIKRVNPDTAADWLRFLKSSGQAPTRKG